MSKKKESITSVATDLMSPFFKKKHVSLSLFQFKTPAKKNKRRQAIVKRRNQQRSLRKNVAYLYRQTINHFFPDLYDLLKTLPDHRQRSHYELFEILFSALLLFLFKKGSRNALNNERGNRRFTQNIKKLLGFRLVHLDTADEVLRLLSEEVLEQLNAKLVHQLLKKKVFASQRLLGNYYLVAVDGSHVLNVPEGHCTSCLKRTHKSGKVTYFHNVLEAKLVTANGFAISLAHVWIENEGDFEKQDCELKAFQRLAKKLKKEFPQLPLCLLADGLYPNQGVFEICEQNQWHWIITLKDGNLTTLWQEIPGLRKLKEVKNRKEVSNQSNYQREYSWYNGFLYNGRELYWFQCIETTETKSTKFAYVSSLEIDYTQVIELTQAGRLRWRIENQGFLNQKQRGYALTHKYSRKSFQATKNYYTLLQIAHLINQLFELQTRIKKAMTSKMTIQHLFIDLLSHIRGKPVKAKKLQLFLGQSIQIRFP